MEVTVRDDVGNDLIAPKTGRGGKLTASYALVPEVHSGDLIVHYNSAAEAIVGVSRAIDGPEATSIFWAPRGASARRAGIAYSWQPAYTVPLEGFTPLPVPLTLEEMRAQETEVMALRQELTQRHAGQSLYFPWNPYPGQAMRTAQSYLRKFPRQVLPMYPTLNTVVESVELRGTAVLPRDDVHEGETEFAEAAQRRPRRGKGQGFHVDQEVKVAVENLAMNSATAFYEGLGYEVEDVHGNSPYDLVCRRGADEKHVEVKGTMTDGAQVLLTPNEVVHARTCGNLDLFILNTISVQRDAEGVLATGGDRVVLENWQIDTGTLLPVGYRYGLPGDG